MTSHKTRVLVVDDEPAMREVLEMLLQKWGFEVRVASDGTEGRELAESYDPDIVISDVVMPQLSGLELLRSLKSGNSARPVILVTAQGSIDMAVEAMKQGAQDFVTKPLDYSKLRAILEAAGKDLQARQEFRKLSSQLEKGAGFGDFVGTSKPMREVYQLIQDLSASDASVIVTGESGTGKELVARTIHKLSARSDGPFIAINAAAIPENLMESEIFGHERGAFTGAVGVRAGCFELANRGDVRVIAATNRDPKEAVDAGKLREDLYYRLNVFTVALPPLRERKGDIALLVQHFIREFNYKHNTRVEAVRDEAVEMLKAYSWRGNVRELKNVMERAVILAKGDWIEPSHLPPYIVSPGKEPSEMLVLPMGITAADAEKELILRTLQKTGNNKAEAARLLGLDVKTIRNKLKSYGLD